MARAFQKTDTLISINLPAAVCISLALDAEIARVERALESSTTASSIRKNRNHLANLKSAEKAFAPVYENCLNAPLLDGEEI